MDASTVYQQSNTFKTTCIYIITLSVTLIIIIELDFITNHDEQYSHKIVRTGSACASICDKTCDLAVFQVKNLCHESRVQISPPEFKSEIRIKNARKTENPNKRTENQPETVTQRLRRSLASDDIEQDFTENDPLKYDESDVYSETLSRSTENEQKVCLTARDILAPLQSKPDLGLIYYHSASTINLRARYAVMGVTRIKAGQTVNYLANLPVACLAWQQIGYSCFIIIVHDEIDLSVDDTVQMTMSELASYNSDNSGSVVILQMQVEKHVMGAPNAEVATVCDLR